MKMLFLLTYYKPHWTGLTQYAVRLAEGLADRGNEVEVLCVRHSNELPSFEILNKVKVFRVPYQLKFSRTLISINFIIKTIYLAWKKETVVVFLPFFEVLPITIILKLFRKKIFLVHNGDLVLPKDGSLVNRIIEKLYYSTTSLSIRFADNIIIQTIDYAQKSKLLIKHKNKWKVILPLYSSQQVSLKQVEDFKKKHKLTDNRLIGYSGRFVEEKGIDTLLKSISYVLAKYPRSMFVFAGQKKIDYERYWDKIKFFIKKHKKSILFLGLIKNSFELTVFYKALDVYIQPSRTDCFPSSQVEAILAGVPVICTDIPGARWVVKITKMGLLVKPDKPISLAKCINEILSDTRRYQKPEKSIKNIFNYHKTLLLYEKLFQGK